MSDSNDNSDVKSSSAGSTPKTKTRQKSKKTAITTSAIESEQSGFKNNATPQHNFTLDNDADDVLKTSNRLAQSKSPDNMHSYSSLLVACMLADNRTSRWFQQRLAELNIKPDAQRLKLGLSEEQLQSLIESDDETTPSKWTSSASEWLKTAQQHAVSCRESTTDEITVRDLIGAFIFARSFHTADRVEMGLTETNLSENDPSVLLGNAFMSYIHINHPQEIDCWSQVFEHEFGTKPSPDIQAGPTTRLNSDSWTVDDRLGYKGYARAIRHFILHPLSEPPLSISIQAPWGAGKTSLMRMIQEELDEEAVTAAQSGGWQSLQADKNSIQQNSLSVRNLLDAIKGTEKPTVTISGKVPERYTVWFNAWKYESSNQLWAGLATAIIEQLTARMRPLEREKFLLRLQIHRIDPVVIRNRIHEMAFSKALLGLKELRFWFFSMLPAAIGLAVELLTSNGTENSGALSSGAVPVGIFASLLVGARNFFNSYSTSKQETELEPVFPTLGELITVPDYDSEIGFTHHVVEDLLHVFNTIREKKLGTKQSCNQTGGSVAPTSEWSPIVIFIDDLDRCSPSRVADVIEGVNMFLAGDFMPCIFVIGMDPQMVSAALEHAHEDIAKRIPRYDQRTPVGWRFMDKFIQLPFTIPPPEPDKIDAYTDYLLQNKEMVKAVSEVDLNSTSPGFEGGNSTLSKKTSLDIAKKLVKERNLDNSAAKFVERTLHNRIALRLQDELSLNFSDSEPVVQEMLREAAHQFSNNPRDIKRLLNVVRFEFLISRSRVADGKPIPDPSTMGKWIALSLKWPAFVRWLQWSAQGVTDELTESPDHNTVRYRLKTIERLAKEESDFENWQLKLYDELGLSEEDVTWDQDPSLHEFFKTLDNQVLSQSAGLGLY